MTSAAVSLKQWLFNLSATLTDNSHTGFHLTLAFISPWLLSHTGFYLTQAFTSPWLLPHPGFYLTLAFISPRPLSHPGFYLTQAFISPRLLSHTGFYLNLAFISPWLLFCCNLQYTCRGRHCLQNCIICLQKKGEKKFCRIKI